MGWGLAAALRRGDVSPIGLAAWTGRGPLLTPNRLDSEMQEVVTLADHPSMSARGHSRRFDRVQLTSGLTPQADIVTDRRHVSKVRLAAIDSPPPQDRAQLPKSFNQEAIV
jgi:hypothetical protein